MNIRDTLGDTAGTVIGAGGGALAGGRMGAIIAGRRKRLMGAGLGAGAGGLAGGVAGHSLGSQRALQNEFSKIDSAWADAKRDKDLAEVASEDQAERQRQASEASLNKDYFSEADLRKAQQN